MDLGLAVVEGCRDVPAWGGESKDRQDQSGGRNSAIVMMCVAVGHGGWLAAAVCNCRSLAQTLPGWDFSAAVATVAVSTVVCDKCELKVSLEKTKQS